jgi:hypothetical protein
MQIFDGDINTSTPAGCASAGGTWVNPLLNRVRSFITNPSGEIEKYMENAIETIFKTNYDPNNFWVQIGTLLGNFIFERLFVNAGASAGAPLDEGSYIFYTPPSAAPPATTQPNPGNMNTSGEMDIDGDYRMDGRDTNGNGNLNDGVDICYFGGPPCIGSNTASPEPPPYPDEPPPWYDGGEGTPTCGHICCDDGTGIPNYADALWNAMADVVNSEPWVGDLLNTQANTWNEFFPRVRNRLAGELDSSWTVLNGNGNPSSGDLFAVWVTGSTTMERYDVIQSVDGGLLIRDSLQTLFTGDIPIDGCIF